MQIAGLSVGFPDAGAVARRNEAGQSPGGLPEGLGTPDTGSSNATMEIMAKIVSRYDLRSITPRDFSEMLRKLRDSGVLSESDYRDLAQIRMDLDEKNIDADESIDLLGFCRKNLRRMQRDSPSTAQNPEETASLTDAVGRRLEWLEKVAILQESPDSAGISALV